MEKKVGDFKNKIPEISGLVTTAVLNTKIGQVENKIPNVTNLLNTTGLNTKVGEVENKIANVTDLVKKTKNIKKRLKYQTLKENVNYC